MAKAYLKEKYAKPAGVYLGIPHRLDRPVSGVVVFCRDTKAATRGTASSRRTRSAKCTGRSSRVGDARRVVGHWVRKIAVEARMVKAAEGEPGAKLATLEYRVLQRLADGRTLLELAPRTGPDAPASGADGVARAPGPGDVIYGSTRRVRAAGREAARPGDRPTRPPADANAPLPEGTHHVRVAVASILGFAAIVEQAPQAALRFGVRNRRRRTTAPSPAQRRQSPAPSPVLGSGRR